MSIDFDTYVNLDDMKATNVKCDNNGTNDHCDLAVEICVSEIGKRYLRQRHSSVATRVVRNQIAINFLWIIIVRKIKYVKKWSYIDYMLK